MVTVTSYEQGVLSGYMQHPRLERRVELKSLSQMLLLLDELLDLENCPNQPLPLIHPECTEEDATVFRIQILFREHYTWQGRLVWQNENQETVFHSAIELLQLLDEILAE